MITNPLGSALPSTLLVMLLHAGVGSAHVHAQEPPSPRERVARLLADARADGAEVGVYYRSTDGRDSLLASPDLRMHAASTMKVPVMLQLYLDDEAGRLDVDGRVPIRTDFRSILDGSTYRLDVSSDSDREIYGLVGQRLSRRDLIERMITRSSNLATNLLIEDVDPRRVTATLRGLGADSIEVLRGVEDIPAFEAGLSNTTTARDMGIVMRALVEGGVASDRSRREMVAVLERQEFRSRIPAGVPEGVRVANKTGGITGIHHDAAIVFPPDQPSYVVVVLIRGYRGEGGRADALAASISAA
ncbi:MAG TPA: serine hydrolase, partial [Longimicrobiales bacterium]|nr:serine hydrolase [Longimicrobiales bacterium]